MSNGRVSPVSGSVVRNHVDQHPQVMALLFPVVALDSWLSPGRLLCGADFRSLNFRCWAGQRPLALTGRGSVYTSVCSAISRASLTSMPR